MRLSRKMAVNLFEATEAIGIARDALTVPLGYDAKRLVDPKDGIEWDVLVAILARLAALVDNDVARVRAVASAPYLHIFEGLLTAAPLLLDHIRVIVRDLLALSRTEEMSTGSVEVRAVVESTLSLAAQKIDERAELVADYEDVPPVRGTPARLGQVLLNLLANALEALPLTSRSVNRLAVSVKRSPDGGAVIEVADNGHGIADEHQTRVFDPFFTTKPFGSGTGLGLSISQNLLSEIGGTISLGSRRGVGSTFRAQLAAVSSPSRVIR